VTIRVIAAKAVIDRALKAHVTIAVEEELAELRELMATIKAGELPAPILVVDPSNEEIRTAEDDQAESARLRVVWMTELGFDGHAIEESLRHNRPHSVEEERYLLEALRKLMEADRELEKFVMENAPK
jgi:hypothetical protein